jgi:hypothetical protein
MPQWRKLHTKIVESLDFHEMPDDFVRLVWLLLPLGVDREGRALDNASLVKSHIMPLRDDVALDDIERALSWFAEHGMIKRYQVNGRAYFLIPTFRRYQGNTTKEAASQYPAPIDLVQSESRASQDLVQSESSTDVDVDVDVDVDSEETRKDAFPSSAFLREAVAQYENTIGLISGAQQANEIESMILGLETANITDWWGLALRVAADQNKRSWAYVRGVLNNCLREGKPPLIRAPANGPPQKRIVKLADGTTVEAIA